MLEGIPYFPLDVHMDDKFDLIEAEFGLKGFALIVKLYQKIYGGFGYYCEWTNDVALLFSRKVGEGCSVVSEIVSAAIKRGIFDKDLYDRYSILTSAGIQKRYFEAVSRRKQIKVIEAYLLVKVDILLKNVDILSENVNIESKNVNISEQSKVEERKVKYSKGEESKDVLSHRIPPPHKKQFGESGRVTLTEDEYMALLSEFGEAVLAEYIGKMDTYLYENGKRYRSCAAKLRQWIAEDKAHKGKKPRGFNNYTDSNKPDYSNFGQKILEEMLSDDES